MKTYRLIFAALVLGGFCATAATDAKDHKGTKECNACCHEKGKGEECKACCFDEKKKK